jgi:hypothetical protein
MMNVFSDRSVQQETTLSSVSRPPTHIPEEGPSPARGRCCSVWATGTRRFPGSRDARQRRDPYSGTGCPSQSVHKHPAIRGGHWASQKVTESATYPSPFHTSYVESHLNEFPFAVVSVRLYREDICSGLLWGLLITYIFLRRIFCLPVQCAATTTICPGRSLPMFQRTALPSSSGSMNNLSKKPVRNKPAWVILPAACFWLADSLAYILIDS